MLHKARKISICRFFGWVVIAQLVLQTAVDGAQNQQQTPQPQIDSVAVMGDSSTADKTSNAEAAVSSLYASGIGQLQNGDAESAATNLAEVLRRDPDHVDAMTNLARAYLDLNRYDQAEAAIVQAIAADSANAEAYLVRGRVAFAKKDLMAAISAYKKSLELEKLNPFAYNNLALIYIQDGRYREAIPLLEQATEQKRGVVFFHNNLGVAYEGAGDLLKAEESFQNAVSIAPDYQRAVVNLDRIQSTMRQMGVSLGNGRANEELIPAQDDTITHVQR
jgi:tetratricopeptide (TPR) repeat protein